MLRGDARSAGAATAWPPRWRYRAASSPRRPSHMRRRPSALRSPADR